MGKAELCSWIPFLPRKWVGRVQWDGGSASSGRIDANWQLMDQQLSQTKTGRAGSLTFCRAEIGLFGVENPGRNRARAQKRRSCVGFGGLTDPRGMVRNAAAPSQSRFSPNQRDFFYIFFCLWKCLISGVTSSSPSKVIFLSLRGNIRGGVAAEVLGSIRDGCLVLTGDAFIWNVGI